MKKETKTNAMRILDRNKIKYTEHTYECDGFTDGVTIAERMGQPCEKVFKTLVTVGKSKQNYVFLVPVNRELNLKKAANAVGEKSIEMIKSKDLLGLTGYIHGGCSPVGMKKAFPTVIDESAKNNEKIFFSAGKIGFQVELLVSDVEKIIKYKFADITE